MAFIEVKKNTNVNFKLLVITLILIPGFVGSASALYADLIAEEDITDMINKMEGKAVLIRTHEGTFMIELFPVDAPNHVYRFLELIKSGYYEGTFFHRLIPGFMVQGGDPNTKHPESPENIWGTGGPGYEMKNEFNTIKHVRGIVSMARGNDLDSAGSQFFIVHKDANHLNGEYTAFGRLIPGTYSLKNLDNMAKIPTGNDNDTPLDPLRSKILETSIIQWTNPGIFTPPQRVDSITRDIRMGGGIVTQYIDSKYGVTLNLPYRWDAVDISTGILGLALEPNSFNHSAAQAIEESGFIPKIFVSSEKRDPNIEGNFVINPDAFFTIKDEAEPEFLNNNLFENEDGRFAHLMTTTQTITDSSSTEPIKFKIIQIHFTDGETNYSIIYINVIDFFRYEINAFDQTVQNFKIMIDGQKRLINFASNDVYKQVIRDGREPPPGGESPFAKSEPESLLGDGGCLIATASYGSELAPQVQQLRELRDNTVLQTKSGSVFMATFNQFYYSFSPMIADYERENPAFKEVVKLAITPLLASLTLLQHTDIDSEYEMLGYGISIILLNMGMYIIAPAVLITKIRSFYKLQ